MESETLHFARYVGVDFCINLCLHNLSVWNTNLSNNILYLMSFTIKLAKQKTDLQNHIFSIFLLHINTQLLLCA